MQAISSLMTTASPQAAGGPDADLRSTFQQAVAGQFFGQLMKAMRATVGKPAYIHGGQAEEMFQSQLDQQVVEDLAESSGAPFIDELYQQFRLQLGLPAETNASDLTLFGSGSGLGPVPDLGNSTRSESSLQPADLTQISQLTEASRQAPLGMIGASGTSGTTALGALFRK